MENLNIYIDRLNEGKTQELAEQIDPSFLQIAEKELFFSAPVDIKGKAYLTDDHLVIELHASTLVKMPCKICNELISIPLEINNSYQTIPLQEIKGAIYNCESIIKESLLLELPSYVECGGSCKNREAIKPFLTKEKTVDSDHFPFSGLE